MWMNYSKYYTLDPFPDELFYSTLARTFKFLGSQSVLEFSHDYFKNPSTDLSAVYPFYRYENQVEIFNHSTLPYYMSSFSIERQKRFIKKYFSRKPEKKPRWSLKNFMAKEFLKPKLSFCPLCLKEDLKEYGIPYFHVSHQYVGINVCPKHGVLLKPFRPNGFKTFDLLEKKDFVEPIEAEPRVQQYSRWAVAFKNFSDEYLKAVYHKVINEVNIKLFEPDLFLRELEKYFGYELLEIIGCSWSELSSRSHKVTGLLHRKVKGIHPIYHFIMWEFLNLDLNDFINPVDVLLLGRYYISIPNVDAFVLVRKDLGVNEYSLDYFDEMVCKFYPLDLNSYINNL